MTVVATPEFQLSPFVTDDHCSIVPVNSILPNDEQFKNASVLMLVTELGIKTLVRLLQPENAHIPISVTEFGNEMLDNPLQFLNALFARLTFKKGFI